MEYMHDVNHGAIQVPGLMAEKGKMSGLGSPDYAERKVGHKAYANIHQGDQICRTGGVDVVPHGPRKCPPGRTGQVVLNRTRNRACSTAMLQPPRSGPIPLQRTTSAPQGDYIL